MKKRVFITGANGFIGANLARKLVSEGYDAIALLRHSNHPFIENIPIKKVLGDVTDKSSIENGLKGCDYVYHCAAKISFNRYDYKDLYNVNVLGTRNLLDIALKFNIERFIYISACAVFGYSKNREEIKDENSDYKVPPNNVYAYTKKLAEDSVKKFCSKGLNAVIANPSTVYGEGDLKLNSGSLIKAIYGNRLKLAPPGGTSVISIDDLLNGLLLLMGKGCVGKNYIFANENIEYIDLFNKIASIVGAREIRFKIPRNFYYPAAGVARVFEVINRDSTIITSQIVKELFRYKYYSSNRAKKELGWEPKVGINDAIRDAFKFYKANGLL